MPHFSPTGPLGGDRRSVAIEARAGRRFNGMMLRRLFLDDERFPPGAESDWVIVRSFPEAIAWVKENGFPDFVSFDNDLGPGQREGWEFAQWLIDVDLASGGMPEDFAFAVHSMNPVRAKDIEGRLTRYLEYRRN